MCQRIPYPMRAFLQFTMLIAAVVTMAGCQPSPLTVEDITPPVVPADSGAKRFGGSVNVQTMVPEMTSPTFVAPLSYWIDSEKLETALVKAVAQKGLFLKVESANADYALDVWIEQVVASVIFAGDGFDVTSVWRLTRIKDGSVLVCDYVKGHGVSQAFGFEAQKQALKIAMCDTIEKGLAMLSDGSTDHLAAISTRGSVPRPYGDMVSDQAPTPSR
jgi:hypothetical protein